MSTAPKRLHEEGGHTPSSKHALEDTSVFNNNLSGKLVQTVPSECQPPPFEAGSDGRPAKVPRTEPRDSDKRFALHSMYRIPSSSNESGLNHLGTSENRLESRDTKDNRDTKVENRDAKVESREFYAEAKIDPQCAKGEKAARSENRGDDINKESKHDREPHMDSKGDIKMEKDGFTAGNSPLICKEPKEHQKGKINAEMSDGLDPWRISRSSSHIPSEIAKDGSTAERRDCLETHEAVGENKIDLKVDDKFKDKEKKRKDEKQKDWGERGKDRNDHRNILQLGNSSSERREPTREERESERWEKERKDLQKEKERSKEREKDHVKKEGLNGFDKEGSQNERELVDGSFRMPEQENPTLEQRRQKEFDCWKAVDRDSKDRKRETDVDVEGDRREKQSRCYEKESDEGCMEGDGGAEREREGFSYGVQQRKRMLRPRGSPQITNREPRFRSRSRDNEEYVYLVY
ncbi:hypothetical protein BVC80_1629g5 [Macleaya cordata]|uniref:Uncharacterized protein n=1 Tax=Macleaya cordata TaxID=56857 RepID=A0A200Q1G5_MACCD|nr:hypothetical protein BVC80_1629g5 [Macleaya cordata]